MEPGPIYEIKSKRLFGSHDGVQVWPDHVVIKQRTRGGEQIIPISAITEVGTGKSLRDLPLLVGTLRIRTAGHTYVVRKLPKAQASEAASHITARMLTTTGGGE